VDAFVAGVVDVPLGVKGVAVQGAVEALNERPVGRDGVDSGVDGASIDAADFALEVDPARADCVAAKGGLAADDHHDLIGVVREPRREHSRKGVADGDLHEVERGKVKGVASGLVELEVVH